jgi:hypothetical protein
VIELLLRSCWLEFFLSLSLILNLLRGSEIVQVCVEILAETLVF